MDFETFSLPGGFEDISSARFIHTGIGTNTGIFFLDNIVVRGITPTSPAAGPPDGPNIGAGVDDLDP